MTDETRDDLFNGQLDQTEELTNETTVDDTTTSRGFHERLGEVEGDEFTRALDPNENPHIGDQLDDPNLQREAEADY